MGRTRLSVLLAHLVLGFAIAEPAFGVTKWQQSAAKRLSLRFSDPLTRRSPDTHFMRFGRSSSSGRSSNGDFTPKVQVKREAYGSTGASASPTPSLTCVPDADSNGRIVCYTPFNVSRHFLLVTESDRGRRQGDDREDETEDEEGDSDDDEGDVDEDDGYDDEIAEEGPVVGSEARNRTEHQDSTKQRFGRSTASQAEGQEAFARFSRRHGNFMRLGRADVGKNESPSHKLGGSLNLGTDYAAISAGDKHGSKNFIRFGRERSLIAYPPLSGNRPDGWNSARAAASASDEDSDSDSDSDQQTTNKSLEGMGYGEKYLTNRKVSESELYHKDRHQRDAFVRLSRHGPGDMNQLRFGRSDRIGARVTRRHGNFMRLGRADRTDPDDNFERAARRHGNFMRLGRTDRTDHDDNFERSARRHDTFMRLGRADRTDHDDNFERAARRHDNFMRLGRSSGNFDLDMFRETRRRDSFLRLGRGGGDSRICGLAADAITPRLLSQLLDDYRPRHRSTANHSTSEDGATATDIAADLPSNVYYDSMVECLRRYMRQSTTDSPAKMRLQPSSTLIADSDSSQAPAWPLVYHHRGSYQSGGDDDDDVYRIAMATAALNSRIKV